MDPNNHTMAFDSNSAYEYLKSSPMFKLSLSSKELFHSNFLEWLSNVNPIAFKSLILDMAGLKGKKYKWPDVWRVKREYNNFDLCIVAYDQYKNNEDEKIDDDEDFRIMFVIENKVKSIPYIEQLKRYTQEAKTKNEIYWKKRGDDLYEASLNEFKKTDVENVMMFWIDIENREWVLKSRKKRRRGQKPDGIFPLGVHTTDVGKWRNNKTDFKKCYAEWKASTTSINYILLSLAKHFPEYIEDSSKTWDVEGTKWKVCNYFDYYSKINKHFNINSKNPKEELSYQIIKDYCDFIKYLTSLTKEWENDYVSEDSQKSKNFHYADNDNYMKAHRFKIHDLYQKLKFSYFCTQLFNEIKKKDISDYWVFPSNQGGLYKDNKKMDNWGPDKKYICVNYTYLHGEPLLEINVHPVCSKDNNLYYAIQVQGIAYEHGIQVKGQKSEKVWEKLEKGKMKILNNWMNIDNSKWKPAEWMAKPDKENKKYNKYDMNDGTYVYQKYIIKNDTKIETVLNQMLADLDNII